jgi:hypothetical protein
MELGCKCCSCKQIYSSLLFRRMRIAVVSNCAAAVRTGGPFGKAYVIAGFEVRGSTSLFSATGSFAAYWQHCGSRVYSSSRKE